jgi:hypothetical protein
VLDEPSAAILNSDLLASARRRFGSGALKRTSSLGALHRVCAALAPASMSPATSAATPNHLAVVKKERNSTSAPRRAASTQTLMP